tara:strand:+ start:125 stop:832 length:708 start_codon:yes stop_codon:yes gene_type:complete
MSKTPRILIASPQADIKNYCFLDWLINLNRFTYDKSCIDLYLVDNSHTEDNAKFIESLGINVRYIPEAGRGIIETMAECHQACLDYAKENNYDYMLHLETDVFPEHTILENLMTLNKPITCGLFHIFDGAYREPMIRMVEDYNSGYMRAYSLAFTQGQHLDGRVMKVYSGALGCCLIRSDVFDKIKFRWVEGEHQFPDTWFAQDMYSQNIPIYVNTKAICKHRNISWGTYGVNFN